VLYLAKYTYILMVQKLSDLYNITVLKVQLYVKAKRLYLFLYHISYVLPLLQSWEYYSTARGKFDQDCRLTNG